MKETLQLASDLLAYFVKYYDNPIPKNKRAKIIAQLNDLVYKLRTISSTYETFAKRSLDACLASIVLIMREINDPTYYTNTNPNKHIIALMGKCISELTDPFV